MNRAVRLVATLSFVGLAACSSTPKDGSPYQYPAAWPNDVSAPAAGGENSEDAATAALQYASYAQKSGATTKQPHISGICLLSDGVSELPCVGVTFVLYNASGTEVSRKRTHGSGRFLFVVDPATHYTIRPLSKSYDEKIEGPAQLAAGTRITVHLKAR